jgi:hypothetical protein
MDYKTPAAAAAAAASTINISVTVGAKRSVDNEGEQEEHAAKKQRSYQTPILNTVLKRSQITNPQRTHVYLEGPQLF